ncbi:hypothetical protein OS493_037789 [Desmophyllum pertusum]|uniref:ABC transporter domain-containing protein n=1 Tax=Desmophyllum pertusum TaxID=174260 RepID=A0A9W9Y747_9CNID|nr:hypothetical protein OS493_037789 [Desmophyllum pertusum]
MGDRSSLLRSKKNPKALGYSTFDPGGSIDSGLSNSTDANRKSRANGIAHAEVVEDAMSGNVEVGTLLAVMGASGAGKTTLMNVLAHRNINQMEVRGTVEVNDRPIGKEIMSMSAYIQQEDLFVGSLTVREHLIFQVRDGVLLCFYKRL